jgi:transposase
MAISTVVARCAGLDIAKASLVACVRVPDTDGGWLVRKRKFTTMSADLLALADWLAEHDVSRVGMESTSDYWRPVFYLLESQLECWLLNARHMRAVPGRKTDMSDAEWICDLVAHGLVRPSFVPPAPIRRLRDLTRRRSTLLAERTREKQRMEKLLDDAGVKLTVVATDIFGKSGRAILDAMVDGQRDGAVLAELALGRMRTKIPALTQALTGHFTDHHAFLTRTICTHADTLTAMIGELDTRIAAEITPYRRHVDLLDSIPGINTRAAEAIIAEVGVDMNQFTSSTRLASWAGICPGNNKTAGKNKPGHIRPGNRWLKAALGTAALAAIRKKDSYLGAQFRRIAARRGNKRAQTAVAHSLLTAIYHVLHDKTTYHDLGGDYFLHRDNPDRQRRRAITQLHRLGYQVTLNPLPT